jgi:predicted transcriptional regulator of viral defense system
MIKKLNPIIVQKELKRKNFSVFTPKEFERIFDVTAGAARQFIHTHTEKKFFTKLRNGLYALEEKRLPAYFVANKLYRPSYVSLETALSFYGIIPETVYSITSVTSSPTQNFDTLGMEFTYTRIKQKAFGGYTVKKEDDKTFFIAEPEKALADYLYLVSIGKKTWNDRFYLKSISRKKLNDYAELFGREKLKELIKKL